MSTVVVAMSGGVDSSVAAALLHQQGYTVIGMMLRLWSEPGREGSNRCCTPDAMAQARRVAAILDIPFYVVDARQPFRDTVVQAFLDGYARGQTPNPCLSCNRVIRWEVLFRHAVAVGAEYMATGHYARRRLRPDGRVELLRALDPTKDQSYVLHVLGQETLRQALFPVGEYAKADVRAMAARLGLPVASRPDSQDLCFLAGEDYRAFVARHAPAMLRPGDIVTRSGQLLGRHGGLANYTIGQRKGLGLASPVPLYVLEKDIAANRLVVGEQAELGRRVLTAVGINWTSGLVPPARFEALVKTRYTASPVPAEVHVAPDQHSARVVFAAAQRDLTPGQAAVFYQGDLVLGGGVIAGVQDFA